MASTFTGQKSPVLIAGRTLACFRPFLRSLNQKLRPVKSFARPTFLDTAAELLDFPFPKQTAPAAVAIILQDTPDQFSAHFVGQILQLNGLKQVYVVCGPWAPSEGRRSGIWPDRCCIPLSDAAELITAELTALAEDHPEAQLPLTAGGDEIFAARHHLRFRRTKNTAPLRQPVVWIVSPDASRRRLLSKLAITSPSLIDARVTAFGMVRPEHLARLREEPDLLIVDQSWDTQYAKLWLTKPEVIRRVQHLPNSRILCLNSETPSNGIQVHPLHIAEQLTDALASAVAA